MIIHRSDAEKNIKKNLHKKALLTMHTDRPNKTFEQNTTILIEILARLSGDIIHK